MKSFNCKKTTLSVGVGLAIFAAQGAKAGVETVAKDTPVIIEEEGGFDFKDLWDLATLYQDNDNPFIQRVKLRGRYQGQHYWMDSSQGNNDGWENRRNRFGVDVTMFDRKVDIRVDAQADSRFTEAYDSLVDAYVRFKPVDGVSLTVGRQKPQIGAFGFVGSSAELQTFERPQITNQLGFDRTPGVVLEVKQDEWTFRGGFYSNHVDSEFGNFDGGYSGSIGVGYDMSGLTGLDKSDLRVDYLHSEPKAGGNVISSYEDIVSVTFMLSQGRFGLANEAYAAFGNTAGRGDVFGVLVEPTWFLVPDRFQLVSRYSFTTGSGTQSVQAQSRYERRSTDLQAGGRGGEYHAIYFGGQYFINGDRLKLMAGVEASRLSGGVGDNLSAVTGFAGVRFFF